MGYGFGVFLMAAGLILALAVGDRVEGVDLVMIGWILAAAGLLLTLLTAVTLNGARRRRTVQTVTHRDGSQTVTEQRDTTA